MCGIAGIVNLDGRPADEALLRAMSDAQWSRGPDGSGVKLLGSAGLAHRRLSIIDLQGGAQPLANEDGSVWITFNGEIYNHLELRRELEAKGHVFKTHCDTEAIVHAYEQFGADCVKRLNGMFAFAIHDLPRRKLLLCRDRLGKKPLNYFFEPNGPAPFFTFASELQALVAHPGVPRDVDQQALHDYFSLQYVPAPRCVYRNVRKLEPGHSLELDIPAKTIQTARYWDVDYATKTTMNFQEAKERLRQLLEQAVSDRLMSDVPLGAFLSGGVDSTIIAGLMAKTCGQKVKTFTIGFAENRYDERPFATLAAKAIGSEHYEKVVNPADFDAVRKLVRHFGEPYSDSSMLPTCLLSQFTRESVTVALSGDGADELFAGYYRYLLMRHARLADLLPLAPRRMLCGLADRLLPRGAEERSLPGKLHRLLNIAASSPDQRYLDIINRFDEQVKLSLYGDAIDRAALRSTQAFMAAARARATATNLVENVMETDLHSYLPGDILPKVDIASMANSLEVRSPFLDHRVVEFAASLPLDFKQRGKVRKRILLEACSDLVPAAIRDRGKLGFGVPVAAWLRGQWSTLSREILLDGGAVKNGFFKRKTVESMLDAHQSGQADLSYALWSMLVFELWHAEFMTRPKETV